MRDKVVSPITWGVIVGLAIADAEGFQPAPYLIAVLTFLWLACVAAPWIVAELSPRWRRRQ